MLKLAISGAGGRMGRKLLALADRDPEFELVQAIEWSGFPLLGQCVNTGNASAAGTKCLIWASKLERGADAVVDFSSPENAVQNARLAAEFGTALVVGTTGLDQSQVETLKEAAKTVPVMHAPNFSLGVNLMFKLAAEAARVLGEDYNIEIVETHHNQKVDAPSGTALGLARAIAAPLGRDLQTDLVHGRRGNTGKRTAREIGMHALRMGTAAGDHTVYFAGECECLSITHHAQSRDVFAVGALRAVKWLAGKKVGYFSMQDMLFA